MVLGGLPGLGVQVGQRWKPQSYPEAWSHTAAAHEPWCREFSGSQRLGEGVRALWGRRKLGGPAVVGVSESSPLAPQLVRDARGGSPHGEQTWHGGPSHAQARGPRGSRYWGSHECGVGSLKNGLSVHPELAFRALSTEEVPIRGGKSLFSPCPHTPLRPRPFGPLCRGELPPAWLPGSGHC